MSQPATNPRLVQFGLFQLDLDARELRKSGVRIKLQEQPFQILSMLLERPGAIVTREELQKKLWPADTFVDFDLSLNSAVKKLRQALNDDSENPRFVETLYRRGYRFIGPVNGGANSNHQIELVQSPASGVSTESGPIQTVAPPSSRKRTFLVYATVALLLILAVVVIAYRLIPSQPPRVLGFTQITHDGLMKLGMLSDGERLYLLELQGDRFAVGQVSVAGGETSMLPTPFPNAELTGIAPNGAALIVGGFEGTGKELGTWSLPLPSGPLRRIDNFRAGSLDWSRDGNIAAFSAGADIFLANPDLSGPRKIATVAGQVRGLRFSPDGRKLHFDLTDPGNSSRSLWEVASDGSQLRQLLPGWNSVPRECCGNWTPNGKYYLFESFRDGRDSIWALPEKLPWFSGPARPVQLTNGPLDFQFPLVSKDGKRIFVIGSQPRCELVRYGGEAGFEPYFDGKSIRDLTFSADGKWMAYVSVPESQLWRSRIDGSERLQLTPDGMYAGLPRWSPDGKQVVFMGTDFKTDWLAYLVSSDGTGLRKMNPDVDSAYDPGWSADGKSIVFTLEPGGDPSSRLQKGIAIADLETGKISPLPDATHLFSPRWSPDGRYIAAITADSLKLTLFDRVSQQWQDLVNLPIGYPSWSHDSQYIYFDTTLNEDPAFFRIRISDHKLERLFSL
ncbi:MAG TPA: winged helix-turn-helix domain-containing protein, partial [Terriglobales bacterium]|nr:winged helix-turn-helix domain-containing protein [Terriglobales bacterium]